jgi:hypothetical protein
MRNAFLAAAAFTLAACSASEESRHAGGISEGEAKALDQAAEMLDSRAMPDGALRPPAGAAQAPQVQAPEARPT